MTSNSPDFLPELLAVHPVASEASDGSFQVVLDLRVPASLAHFPGHFPGLAVLPGVVQIDWAVHYARQHLNLRGDFQSLENIKFLALVLPGAELALHLKWEGKKQRLEFLFSSPVRKYASGRIVFG